MSERSGGGTSKTPRPERKRRAPETAGATGRGGFDPAQLHRTVIAIPLLRQLQDEQAERSPRKLPALYDVVMDLNLDYAGGREAAQQKATELVVQAIERAADPRVRSSQRINESSSLSSQYLFATLEGDVIREFVHLDGEFAPSLAAAPAAGAPATSPPPDKPRATMRQRSVFRIWLDFDVKALITTSIRTVKADAAHASFSALGDDMVWAVLDSGIESSHPHFDMHQNLQLDPPLAHMDYTTDKPVPLQPSEVTDAFGHGTHVAGIIAGEMVADPANHREIVAYRSRKDEGDNVVYDEVRVDRITGMAPRCKLISMKVLDDQGAGKTRAIILALQEVQRLNEHGRRLLIHGVNLSVGYPFDPEWFACGQSPLCVEVSRLVDSGVVVVVAAGNDGYVYTQSATSGLPVSSGLGLTINDPGNAEKAITVGSTHRDMPHVYGVSYFSSKGPTGDGRPKPDLVAPGERILSAAGGSKRQEASRTIGRDVDYLEDSGTSMAAPHVSGVIAGFLSVRREFIGNPETLKEIFVSTAIDLRRERSFQGAGLVDLMRAIQSV